MKLTKQSVAELVLPEGKTDVIFFDDALPGFGVRLRAGGRAVWIVQYRTVRGQRRETLGDVRKLDLDVARAAAKKIFARVLLGADPQGEKAEAKQRERLTLGPLVARFLEFKKPQLRPSTFASEQRQLRGHWAPLHRLPIHAIKRRDVAARLSEIAAQNGPVAASCARGSLSAFFSWAIKEGIAEDNPVSGTNDPGEGRKPRERVLSEREMLTLWNACGEDDFGRIIRLLMMLGARRNEIGGLRWSEVDLEAGTLSIPGSRTKNGNPLELPLPPGAIEILRSAPRREGREFIFGTRGGAFSGWAYATAAFNLRIVKLTGGSLAPWRLHDIRRSVATHMGELGIQPHVIEGVINHLVGSRSAIGRVYNKSTYSREVRTAIMMWADHLQSIVEGTDRKVVQMRSKEVPG
jgi:integrase